MRRLTKIAAASAVLSLALVGCANDSDTAGGEEGLCDGGGDGPVVGLAYDVGGRGDQSFNDSAARGMEQAVDELDATCTRGTSSSTSARSAWAPACWPPSR